ncbi:MAG: hypothetical protein ABIR18_10660 [Chitinophagaceae bacterium]
MEQSTNWEKVKIISTTASIVIIPLVIAFLGNLYSKSIKEKEIQSKFVELSLQILKEQPSEENKNIRKWAIDVINEYSGVKLESGAAKDLIENIPLTMDKANSIDVPVLNSNTPIQVQVVFGAESIGTANISVYDATNKLLAKFTSKASEAYTLPTFDLANNPYFTVVIHGVSTDLSLETNKGTVQVTFSQDKKVIAAQTFNYTYEKEGGINNFSTTGKIFLKK